MREEQSELTVCHKLRSFPHALIVTNQKKLSKILPGSHLCLTCHPLSAAAASGLYGLSARLLSGFLVLMETNERRESELPPGVERSHFHLSSSTRAPRNRSAPLCTRTCALTRVRRNKNRKQYLYLFERLCVNTCAQMCHKCGCSVWIIYEDLVWQSAGKPCCYLLA